MRRKTVILLFETSAEKESAIDFLLAMKLNFQAIVGKPILLVSQKTFKKYDLDLYLNPKSCASRL